MSFLWPLALPVLLAVPALLGGYLWVIRRRRREAVTYSSVALIRAAAPRVPPWRRHAPVALLLAALVLLGLAGARPVLRTAVPVSGSAVILAVDVSGSMCSTDVDPNRLSAAQAAVRDFVEQQDDDTRIGLVVFSGSAQIAVPPTTEREPVRHAIDGLTTARGTTIGAAILKSVDAIAEINPHVRPAGVEEGTGASPAPPAPAAGSVPYTPEIVVLLTDGANTAGIEPVPAARIAASRGVRVYPIGFGTTHPTSMVCTAAQLGGSDFGNRAPGGFPGAGTGRRNFLVADEGTLRQVATITGGMYFSATGAEALQGVLADLPRQVQSTTRDVELSVALAALAVLLVLLALAAAARWSPFPG